VEENLGENTSYNTTIPGKLLEIANTNSSTASSLNPAQKCVFAIHFGGAQAVW
jgi:hypothetical protein